MTSPREEAARPARFRVVFIEYEDGVEGDTKTRSFATYEQALKFCEGLRQDHEERGDGDAKRGVMHTYSLLWPGRTGFSGLGSGPSHEGRG